jgi:hypothetical protein
MHVNIKIFYSHKYTQVNSKVPTSFNLSKIFKTNKFSFQLYLTKKIQNNPFNPFLPTEISSSIQPFSFQPNHSLNFSRWNKEDSLALKFFPI